MLRPEPICVSRIRSISSLNSASIDFTLLGNSYFDLYNTLSTIKLSLTRSQTAVTIL